MPCLARTKNNKPCRYPTNNRFCFMHQGEAKASRYYEALKVNQSRADSAVARLTAVETRFCKSQGELSEAREELHSLTKLLQETQSRLDEVLRQKAEGDTLIEDLRGVIKSLQADNESMRPSHEAFGVITRYETARRSLELRNVDPFANNVPDKEFQLVGLRSADHFHQLRRDRNLIAHELDIARLPCRSFRLLAN